MDVENVAEKTAVILMGGPQSASTELARALSLLGFATATSDPEQNGAASGSAEHDDIGRLNDNILAECGLPWDRPAVFIAQRKRPIESARIVGAAISRRYADQAAAALRSAYGTAPSIVIDDPRVALFPALWDRALRGAGFVPRRVLIVNNPIDVVEWLNRHFQLARPRGLQLWLRDTLAALGNGVATPDAIVTPAALRQDKSRLVFKMLALLGCFDPSFADHADAIDAELADRLAEPPLPPDVLFRRPLISDLIKDTYRLCLDWHDRDAAGRSDVVTDLKQRFEEFCLNASAFAPVPDAVLSEPMPAAPRIVAAPVYGTAAGNTRYVIIHYHLFKNAGTSVDAILKRNFGTQWIAREYEAQSAADMATSLRALLLERTEIVALSSHTLLLPPPELPGVEIFPIIFIRHPIDRLNSAYIFERVQQSNTEGARIAKETDFAGYLRARLANPRDRFCRSPQTARLAMAPRPNGKSELDRAFEAFDTLPFVGSVEAFSASVAALQRLLAADFPGFHAFEAFENVTRPERSLDRKLGAIREEIGDALFETLVEANADDLLLYERALGQYVGDAGARDGPTAVAAG